MENINSSALINTEAQKMLHGIANWEAPDVESFLKEVTKILVRKKDGSFQGYNGMTEVPINYTPPEIAVNSGHKTIATPGVVASLMRLYKEHGSLPLPQIMEASIKYATEGFEILPGEAIRHEIAHKAMLSDPGFRGQMLKNDSILYESGEILKQPDLANTLQRISNTKGNDFYKGEIAQKIVTDREANGGYVSLEDLKNYEAPDMRYVTTDYRGYQIHTMPAPSGGGLLIKTLNILENFDLRKNPLTPWLTPEMVDKVRNFETVLNGYYPTASDFRIRGWKKNLLRRVSNWRYKTNSYKYPYEIKALHKIWKYKQPEIEGFYSE